MVKLSCYSLITAYVFCFIIILTAASFAAEMPVFTDTRVDIPWKTFNELRQNRTDTVVVNSHENPPVPILFEKAEILLTIKDTIINCKLLIDYTVLSNQKWACSVFMPGNQALSFYRVICPDGDYIYSTDSGYVLISENRNGKKSKRLICEWYETSISEDGLGSSSISLPSVSQCKIKLTVPSGYYDVSIDGCQLVSELKSSGKRELTFIVPSSIKDAELRFVSPSKSQIEDTVDVSVDSLKVIKGGEKITSEQKSIIFINDGTELCLTALTINAVQTQPSSFIVGLPQKYSLLRIDGNGIRKWVPVAPDTIKVQLQFNIEDSYTAVFVMEKESDSCGFVPFIDLKGASHQSGSFLFSIKGSDEIIFKKTGNCNLIATSEFNRDINQEMYESITTLANEGITSVNTFNNLSEGAVAGSFYKTPLDAQITIRHHKAIPVAQAITDSAIITTCLTSDWKLLTQATYIVSQKDKKYLAVSLPENCDIWQVNVNGKERSPLIDNENKIRIILPQDDFKRHGNEKIVVNIVFFQKISQTGHLKLKAPTPDIPVSEMSWVVFYSSKQRMTDIRGDFDVSKGVLFKKRYQKNKNESVDLYQSLLKSSRIQKIPLMLESSPKHIFGKKILVVNEQPVLELTIGSKSYFNGLAIIGFVLIAVIILVVFLRKIVLLRKI